MRSGILPNLVIPVVPVPGRVAHPNAQEMSIQEWDAYMPFTEDTVRQARSPGLCRPVSSSLRDRSVKEV